MENERRRSPRYSFAGKAEITANPPGAFATANVSELSLRGCRLDIKSPFPVNLPITVKISASGDLFECKAKIIYLQPQSRAVLQRWLDAASKGAPPRSA